MGFFEDMNFDIQENINIFLMFLINQGLIYDYSGISLLFWDPKPNLSKIGKPMFSHSNFLFKPAMFNLLDLEIDCCAPVLKPEIVPMFSFYTYSKD